MPRAFSTERLAELPLIGILRGFDAAQTALALAAARAGGLTTAEITLDTPQAPQRIREACAAQGDALQIGAGTVLTPAQVDLAAAAGASFIVTPAFHPGVVARCHALGLPVFPGALSPTEILRAHEAGAAGVKVFPADRLGPGFVRWLLEEFPGLPLVPTGGVGPETLGAWAAAGARAVGIGSPLFARDRLVAGDGAWIEARTRVLAAAWRDAASPALP